MKTIKFFTDTETTGLIKELDQILAYSEVLELPGGQTVVEKEVHCLLKGNVIPNAGALLVNNINPFVKEWKQTAVSEYQAVESLVSLAEEYKNKNLRVVLIAYNAPFDEGMYEAMFSRHGKKFREHFPIIWDPYVTARKLVEAGVIQTPEIQATYSKSYKSAKLEHVFIALGNDSSMFKAHTALDDTKMLQVAAHGIYYLATGKKLEDMEANPESYLPGQNVHVILDEKVSGLIKRHLRIWFNDVANKRVLVVDEEMTKNQTPESVILWMNYGDIIDQVPLEKYPLERLEVFIQKHQQTLTEVANSILAKKEKVVTKKDFSLVAALADKMINSDNVKKTFKELTEEEIELLPLAETHAFGKYGKGWRREIEGPNYLNQVKTLKLNSKLSLTLDPVGKYILSFEDEVKLETEKKTELQEKILALMDTNKDDQSYKDLVKKIPSTGDFTNKKHPKDIIEEYDEKKALVFNGANKEQKDLMADLLKFYKEQQPEAFKDVALPTFKLDLSNLLKKK